MKLLMSFVILFIACQVNAHTSPTDCLISAEHLSDGLYNIHIQTAKGALVNKFVVQK